MPDIHKQLGFDFWWDTQKLWEVDLPVEEMATSDFLWMLEIPFWDDKGIPTSLTPLAVKQNPEKFAQQYERTMEADLSYPINAIFLNDRWVIMDGIHRLLKAHILDEEKVRVKKAYGKDIPLIQQ